MLNQLNQYAIQHNIDVDFFSMRAIKALSIPGAIALNPLMIHTMPELIDAYSHELGHHETGSFYKIDSKYETRQRMEEKATQSRVNSFSARIGRKKRLRCRIPDCLLMNRGQSLCSEKNQKKD